MYLILYIALCSETFFFSDFYNRMAFMIGPCTCIYFNIIIRSPGFWFTPLPINPWPISFRKHEAVFYDWLHMRIADLIATFNTWASWICPSLKCKQHVRSLLKHSVILTSWHKCAFKVPPKWWSNRGVNKKAN